MRKKKKKNTRTHLSRIGWRGGNSGGLCHQSSCLRFFARMAAGCLQAAGGSTRLLFLPSFGSFPAGIHEMRRVSQVADVTNLYLVSLPPQSSNKKKRPPVLWETASSPRSILPPPPLLLHCLGRGHTASLYPRTRARLLRRMNERQRGGSDDGLTHEGEQNGKVGILFFFLL